MIYEVELREDVDEAIIMILKRMILGREAKIPALPPHPLFDDHGWQDMLVNARGWLRKIDGRWRFRVEYDPFLTTRIDELKSFLSREVHTEVQDGQGELYFNIGFI